MQTRELCSGSVLQERAAGASSLACAGLKVPITPKTFLATINFYIALSKILQKFFHLVETSIFCEFSKFFFFPARPSEAKTGASDIIPGFSGHLHQLVIV